MLGITSEKRVEELEKQLRELETHLRHAEIAADGLEFVNGKLSSELMQEKSRFKILAKDATALHELSKRQSAKIESLRSRIATLEIASVKKGPSEQHVEDLKRQIASLSEFKEAHKSLGQIKHEAGIREAKMQKLTRQLAAREENEAFQQRVFRALPDEAREIYKDTQAALKELERIEKEKAAQL